MAPPKFRGYGLTGRMELLFSNYLGHYSYSFQVSVELICITFTVFFVFFCAECSYRKLFPSAILKALLQSQQHELIVFKLNIYFLKEW